jgi:predicted amidohydrolase YtcJ
MAVFSPSSGIYKKPNKEPGMNVVVKRTYCRLLLGALLLAPGLVLGAPAPDIILFNGHIFTGDSSQTPAEALAISAERISAVGDNQSIKALAAPNTRQLDLGGRTVIPGINDAHNHISVDPANTLQLSLKTMDPTWSEMQRAITQAAKTSPPGAILTGDFAAAIYFNPEVNRAAIDRIAPDHAVILTCLTGHAAIVNSAALQQLGISEATKDPAAGRYERSADGQLTGIIREYATLQITRRLADLTSEGDAIRQLERLYARAAKFGITSIQDMSDAFTPQRIVHLLQKSRSPLRVRVMRMPLTTPIGRDVAEGLNESIHPSARVVVSGTKWMLDGTPFEGTLTPPASWQVVAAGRNDRAWIELPLSFSQSDMQAMLLEALAHKDQLMVHVSGYPAVSAMLGAMQATGGKAVWADKRVRFEHGDAVFQDLVPQARELGIIVVQNPTHFATGFVAEQAFPLKSLLAAGIPVALGSDGPLNPYLNIMLAAQHPGHPSEAITREQAVIAYTRTAAYAEFAEQDKGTLESGKLADLAVLSQDIFAIPPADLPKTESILTLVGGRIVYDAGRLDRSNGHRRVALNR